MNGRGARAEAEVLNPTEEEGVVSFKFANSDHPQVKTSTVKSESEREKMEAKPETMTLDADQIGSLFSTTFPEKEKVVSVDRQFRGQLH